MADQNRKAQRVTLAGMGVNLLLVLLKGVVGFLSRSTALVADAVHSLSDFGSDFVVLAGLRLADRPPDHTHRYGHGKFETLAAFVLSLFLLATGVGIALSGLHRILGGEDFPAPGVGALAALAVSLLAKEWMFRYTRAWGERLRRPSLVANAIHHRSDALSSLGALAGVAGARFLGPQWRLLDPLAALVVAGFICAAAWGILKSSVRELLDAALEPDMENEIRRLASEVPGAFSPHSLRSRRIGRTLAVELHIEVDPHLRVGEANRISAEVERRLLNRFKDDIIVSIHCDPRPGEPEA